MARIVALLDSMWGGEGEAARYFRISPDNLSGRRLYRLCGDANLLVTNSCREMQQTAGGHGIPDPAWVTENLKRLEPFELLLVCGRVAWQAYLGVLRDYPKVLMIDHPAARRWSNKKLDETTSQIKAMINP
jgi:uracil-DNA glycosylase